MPRPTTKKSSQENVIKFIALENIFSPILSLLSCCSWYQPAYVKSFDSFSFICEELIKSNVRKFATAKLIWQRYVIFQLVPRLAFLNSRIVPFFLISSILLLFVHLYPFCELTCRQWCLINIKQCHTCVFFTSRIY